MDPIPKHMLCPHCKSVLDNPCLQGEADGQATMTAFCSVCQRNVELILSAKAAHVFGLTPGVRVYA